MKGQKRREVTTTLETRKAKICRHQRTEEMTKEGSKKEIGKGAETVQGKTKETEERNKRGKRREDNEKKQKT